MVWEIPYTFIAGTKAKANEVNRNFTSIKQFVDQLESNLATAELDISNLEANKADINGSQTEIFQVANAANNFDAVNLQSLKDQTANSLDAIRGFVPSKSNATTISCTAGDCWDSTYEQMISSSTSIKLQDTSLASNSTYYIYVCYDKETSGCQLAFSTNSNTPTLPAGYDYYRKVGQFTTNSSGDIDIVSALGTVQFPSKLTTNGYTRLPNGLTFQWGVFTKSWAGAWDTTATVTFPTPFKSACFGVFEANNCKQNAGDKCLKFTIQSITNSNFTFLWQMERFNYSDNAKLYWFAIGV